MNEIETPTQNTRAIERTEAAHPVRRLRVVDYMVLAFAAFTLVLMPILAGGPDLGEAQSEGNSFSAEQRQALAASRGDAAASAAAENAADGSSGAAPMVRGADGQPVDDQTRQAIDQASRGDAAARGSVGSDYDQFGGRH